MLLAEPLVLHAKGAAHVRELERQLPLRRRPGRVCIIVIAAATAAASTTTTCTSGAPEPTTHSSRNLVASIGRSRRRMRKRRRKRWRSSNGAFSRCLPEHSMAAFTDRATTVAYYCCSSRTNSCNNSGRWLGMRQRSIERRPRGAARLIATTELQGHRFSVTLTTNRIPVASPSI